MIIWFETEVDKQGNNNSKVEISDSKVLNEIDVVEMEEADVEIVNADAIDDVEINDAVALFSTIMTQCNVNHSSHGTI